MDPEEIEARKYLGAVVTYNHCLDYIFPQASEKIHHPSFIALWDQLQYGIALNNGAQKFYINKKTNSNRVFIPPKFLTIAWGDDPRYWKWVLLEEWGKSVILGELIQVSWFDVRGSVQISLLSANILYLATFVVLLTKDAEGWDYPLNLVLKRADGSIVESKVSIKGKPIGEYFEVDAGTFILDKNHGCHTSGKIECSMYEHGGHWKRGLIMKGLLVRSQASDGCPHADG